MIINKKEARRCSIYGENIWWVFSFVCFERGSGGKEGQQPEILVTKQPEFYQRDISNNL